MKHGGIGAAAALAVWAFASACGGSDPADQGARIQAVAATRGDLALNAEATGTVEPIRQVEVKSKASGEIVRLHVDVGDQVRPGDLLAEIDPRDVQNGYNQARADLEVARARAEISRAQLDRSEQLIAARVITAQEHESARLDYANASAQLVKAETSFALAELQLNDVRIRAPMAGTIIQKNVEEGAVIQSASQNVSGGSTLFMMANLDEMQVRTLVDETDMGQLRAGMQATVTVEAFPDETFRGEVEKIEPQAQVEQNVTMFPVIVTLDNRDGLLKPGMNAEVGILIDRASDVVLVANNAVVQPGDVGPAAMVLGLDVESMDLSAFVSAGRGGRGGRAPAPATSDPEQGGARAAEGATPPRAGERVQALREAFQRGEIGPDSMRALARAGRGGSRTGAGGEGDDAGAPRVRETKPAVVFVIGADSVPVPRLIQVGLNDWDYTEVVSGVEEGEMLAVVGAAQLQAQQQEFLDRMRSRAGANPFGGGGGPGRGRF